MNEAIDSSATRLCKACGLCCTGHLFVWAKLRSVELEPAQKLGLTVIRDPRQRGFNQPCPLWDGVCTIYTSPHYPRFCHTYKCKLLKRLLDESIVLSDALTVVQQTKELIKTIEPFLPEIETENFRERLVAQIEELKRNIDLSDVDFIFRQKVRELLARYENDFDVSDLIDTSD